MADVKVNLEDLERFTKELDQFNVRAEAMLKELNFRFNRVGETWKDAEHQRFAQEFKDSSKNLERFIVSSQKHIPVLRKRVESLRAYLNSR
ncbi:MAG: hypothetical protein ACR2OU_05755 [Thermomicrobiales bacterium]